MPSGMIALAAQPTQSKRVSETIGHAASNCIESIVEVAERCARSALPSDFSGVLCWEMTRYGR
jgi:hypothetical protein